MSGLHLSHKLPWNSLVSYYQNYKHPCIKLPVCESNKIHVASNKIKHMIKNKKYLEDQVCCGNCEIIGDKCFRKSYKKIDVFFKDECKEDLQYLRVDFFDKFRSTIFEFIETLNKGKNCPSTSKTNVIGGHEKEYLAKIIPSYEDHKWSGELLHCDRCNYIINLIETRNMHVLNLLTVEELNNYFGCHHTQAIGRTMPFLFDHIVLTYLTTNIIFASNNLTNQENWGYMKPKCYFRSNLDTACDGQTFLPSLRKYLKDNVYMIDLNATKELCKKLFEFIYIYTYLEMKMGCRLEIDECKERFFIY